MFFFRVIPDGSLTSLPRIIHDTKASEVAIICPLTGPTIHTGDLWVGKTTRKLAVAVNLYVSCKSAVRDVVKTKGIFTPSDKL